MTILELIEKKKLGQKLDQSEISYFIDGYVKGDIPDYQVSALLMAIWFSGLDEEESSFMTMSMAESGEQIDLGPLGPGVVDKHSTGGVADTTTLIAAPAAAACGVKVAKMSGRGLGHTGGTIDKLESIPGFRVELSIDEFFKQVNSCSLAVTSQSGNLVPADKKIYGLRDVTGTVDCMGLIAASIMSKKLASGAPNIVLDVKTGNGAFMKNIEDSRSLAALMVDIGRRCGRKMSAVITDMNQPLGNAIGNALEVKEAIEILSGSCDGDLYEVSVQLAARMVFLAGMEAALSSAVQRIRRVIADGTALQSLAAMIEAQGGDPLVCRNPDLLPSASKTARWMASSSGYINRMNTENIGRACQALGAGRMTKSDIIDPAVGLWMKKRLNQKIEAGEVIADIFYNDDDRLKACQKILSGSIEIGTERMNNLQLIYDRID